MKTGWMVLVMLVAGGTLWSAAPRSKARPAPSDRAFAQQLAQTNAVEIVLGEVCLAHCLSDDVRTYAQMVVDSHTLTAERLITLMGRRGLTTPPLVRPNEKELQLRGAAPAELDSAYITHMVESHRQMVTLVEKESGKGKDPEFREFAQNLLPIVLHHQAAAERLRAALDKKP